MSGVAENLADMIVAGVDEAPEFFVEGYRGALFRAEVVKLNFFSNRVQPANSEVTKRAVCTLTIPLADLKDIVGELAKLIDHVESQAINRNEGSVP